MTTTAQPKFETIFPACRRLLGQAGWEKALAGLEPAAGPGELVQALTASSPPGAPPFVSGLARVELARHRAAQAGPPGSAPSGLRVHPALQLVEVDYLGLAELLEPAGQAPSPRLGQAFVACWPDPHGGGILVRELSQAELLALKLVVEEISPRQGAASTQAPPGVFANALKQAVRQGLMQAPPSSLRRDARRFPDLGQGQQFMAAQAFTLQWHITQACDLSCRHCYDRSARRQVEYEEGLRILDQLFDFCEQRHLLGQVSFSGGNPLLHPRFSELLAAAHQRGLTVGILGNPCSQNELDKLLAVGAPSFFQVSLEGLQEHNDYMRGAGHFARTLEFLDLLADRGVYSMVMLTLTRDNLGQVIELGKFLEGRCQVFNFNRLALVGQGASLALPQPAEYQNFLAQYLDAAQNHPVLGLKDSLFNPLLAQRGDPLMGGCTGFGCGAAFNFLAALPDGEVHACRKFPSLVGDLGSQSLSQIYDSPQARKYRARSQACAECDLRTICGGCLAVTASLGLDIAKDRDPFCMYQE